MFPNLNSLIAKTTTLIDILAYLGLKAGMTGSSNRGLYHDFYPFVSKKPLSTQYRFPDHSARHPPPLLMTHLDLQDYSCPLSSTIENKLYPAVVA